MFRFVYFFGFAVFISACSTTPKLPPQERMVSPGVYISPAAQENLLAFEKGRVMNCLKMEEEFNSGGVVSEEDFIFVCDVNQFSFVSSEIQEECASQALTSSKICKAFNEWQEAPDGLWEDIFLTTLKEVMNARQYNPWQIIKPNPGSQEKVAVTHLQLGNIFAELSIQFDAYNKSSMTLKDKIEVANSKKNLGFLTEDWQNFYLPSVRFLLVSGGVTEEKILTEIFILDSEGEKTGETLFSKPFEVSPNGWVQEYLPISGDLIPTLNKVPAISVEGYFETPGGKETIFSFRLDRGEAEKVFRELMDYFWTTSALINN